VHSGELDRRRARLKICRLQSLAMSRITARTHAESHRRGGLIIGYAGSWSGSVGRDGSVLAVSDTAVAHAVALTSVAKWPGTAQFGTGQYVWLAVAAAQGRRASNTAASRSDKHGSSSASTHHNDARTRPTRQGKRTRRRSRQARGRDTAAGQSKVCACMLYFLLN
jgi:hypothetical protein